MSGVPQEMKERTALTTLTDFQKEFNPVLEDFFSSKVKKYPPAAQDMIKRLGNFCMQDGKRIRPYLTTVSYRLLGGQDNTLALQLSIIPELIHNFLLVHDDIMDKSDTRRGVPTIHKAYERTSSYDASHFGQSMAILAGDLLHSLAGGALMELPMQADKKVALQAVIERAVQRTIFGQELDLRINQQETATRDEILTMQQYKTAYYTFDAPLKMGAIAAGAIEQDIQKLSEYALASGTAFQITDDILDNETSTNKELTSKYIDRAKNSLEWFSSPQYDQGAKQELVSLADFIIHRKS